MIAFTTLTGLSLAEVAARLDAELPPDAYSRVPGAVDLTDIDPAYMRHVLNAVFGLCGLGWGYDFAVGDLDVTYGDKNVLAVCRRLTFWFKLADAGEVRCFEIRATGASENRNAQYAMKGALTNAIGNAVSNLGFQESVYMGRRSHATVGRRPAAAPSKTPAAKNGKDSAQPASDSGEFIVTIGTQHKGKAVKDLPPAALVWFAEKMAATTPAAQATKEACAAWLRAHPELRAAASNGGTVRIAAPQGG